MGQSLSCVRSRLQIALVHVVGVVLTYAQGIEQNTKRHRSGAFFYRRSADVDLERAQRDNVRPVIHVSRPGDENVPLERVKVVAATKAEQAEGAGSAAAASAATGSGPSFPERALKVHASEPRRFHLSRSSTPTAPTLLGRAHVDKRSRYLSPAVFVERSKRKRVSRKKLKKHVPEMATVGGSTARNDGGQTAMDGAGKKTEVRLPKRPGSTKPPTSARMVVPLPPSLFNHGDADMDQLAREMNEYTLQTISHDLARINVESEQETAFIAARKATAEVQQQRRQPESMRLKPKVPAKRYADRHPEMAREEQVAAVAVIKEQLEVMDVDDESDTDDEDYVVDTYVRVSDHSLGTKIPPEKVGLLVFDTEPDVEFFYGDESDSEPELEDDEDENGT